MSVVSGLELRPQLGGWWLEGKAADLPGLGGRLMPSDPFSISIDSPLIYFSC